MALNPSIKVLQFIVILCSIYFVYSTYLKKKPYEMLTNKVEDIWTKKEWPWKGKTQARLKYDIRDGKYWTSLMFGTPTNWGGGALYRGKINVDKDGNKCIPWRDYAKNKRAWPDFLKTEEMRKNTLGDKDGIHNYCRNPDKSDTLWCYTEEFKKGTCQMKDVINEHNNHECVKINNGWDGGKVSSISKESGKREWIDVNQIEASKIVPFTKNKWQDCLRQCNADKECSGFTFGNYTQQTCHKDGKGKDKGKDKDKDKGNKCDCILYKGGKLSKAKKMGILGSDVKCIKKKRLYSDINANFHAGFSGLCQCRNGKAAEGIECPKDGALKCTSCSLGYKLKDGRCIVDDAFLRDIRDNKLLSSKSKKERIIEVDRSPQVSTYSGGELINILQGRLSESKSKVQVIEQETTKSKAKIDKLSTTKSNLEEKLKYKEDIQRKEITRVSQLLIDITKDIENIGILHNNEVSQMISNHRNNIYKMEKDFKLLIENLKKETQTKANKMIESYKKKMEQENYDSVNQMRRYLYLNVTPKLNNLKTGMADMERRVGAAQKLKDETATERLKVADLLKDLRDEKDLLDKQELKARDRVVSLDALISGEGAAETNLENLKRDYDTQIRNLEKAITYANNDLVNKRNTFIAKLKAQRENLLENIIKYTGKITQLDLAVLIVRSISFDWIKWERLKEDPYMMRDFDYVKNMYGEHIADWRPDITGSEPELLLNGKSDIQTDIKYTITAPVETIQFKMRIKTYPNVTNVTGSGNNDFKKAKSAERAGNTWTNSTAFNLDSNINNFSVTVEYIFNGEKRSFPINIKVRLPSINTRAWKACRCQTKENSMEPVDENKSGGFFKCRELYKGRKFDKDGGERDWPGSANLKTFGAPSITYHGGDAYGPNPNDPTQDLTNQDFPPCNRSSKLNYINDNCYLNSTSKPRSQTNYWTTYNDSILNIFSQSNDNWKKIRETTPKYDNEKYSHIAFNPPTSVTDCKTHHPLHGKNIQLDNGWVQSWNHTLRKPEWKLRGFPPFRGPFSEIRNGYRGSSRIIGTTAAGPRAEERNPSFNQATMCMSGCWDYTRDVQKDRYADADSKAIAIAKEYCNNHVKCGGFNIHSIFKMNSRKHICFLKANDNGLNKFDWGSYSFHKCEKGYSRKVEMDEDYSNSDGQYTCEYGIKANYKWGINIGSQCQNKYIGICSYDAKSHNNKWRKISNNYLPVGTTPGVASHVAGGQYKTPTGAIGPYLIPVSSSKDKFCFPR